MRWFIESKSWEWIFSGIGVAALTAFFAWLLKRKRRQAAGIENEIPIPSADSISIHAGGDVSIAKDQAKSVQVKDSQIGVLGDDAKIQGGIHFNNDKSSGKQP